ncbi:MAG: 16S rRNA (uracil(1498)-N(3))-methyltransferase [Limnohabitans sp.]|jgi:16S rRNA (uracil1498-N3)-methyltransferase|uniref:16S rRNA (uracil(1498)-N(3))-methyltransferase n=1 Tax=Limnohabitans sp. TaxID=1907725 RepID=UPI0025E92EBD|nr:16S rRNA (uracil(1498)-N(3))-methyltransferase [Limnohabitans sp.]MCO4089735.1 16S rRNA (uracil(1498)-N(3))-methyltransferase [Limnohabitans sp.]
MPRFYCPAPLDTGLTLSLPAGAARHVQVLRMQPGDVITLFNGEGGEFNATVTRMGRSDVDVEVGTHHPVEREATRAVHLLAGITANERMDWLVEKATELGVASITPLVAERSVLKLKGERADKKLAHWQGVAVAAAEQCGRNRVPTVHPAVTLIEWLKKASPGERWVLSLSEGTLPLKQMTGNAPVTVLSGPEGGLSPAEDTTALAAGFVPVTLGSRVLRAETAPLAVLAVCSA